MKLSSDRFLIAAAPGNCYWCEAENRFIQLILPPGSQVLEGSDDYPVEGDIADDFISLSWIVSIDAAARSKVNEVSPLWKIGESKTLQERVYMNHCVACGAHQGDYYLTEPSMPFWPMMEEEARLIKVSSVDCAIQVEAMSPSGGLLFAIGADGIGALCERPQPRRKLPRTKRTKR